MNSANSNNTLQIPIKIMVILRHVCYIVRENCLFNIDEQLLRKTFITTEQVL